MRVTDDDDDARARGGDRGRATAEEVARLREATRRLQKEASAKERAAFQQQQLAAKLEAQVATLKAACAEKNVKVPAFARTEL